MQIRQKIVPDSTLVQVQNADVDGVMQNSVCRCAVQRCVLVGGAAASATRQDADTAINRNTKPSTLDHTNTI
eukprot:3933430-Rhodomonas_salina.10